jgi:hypothetical protein
VLCRIREQAVGDLGGTAESHQVTAIDLVGHDPQPSLHDPPLEIDREEAVAAGNEDAGWNGRPRAEWPWLGLVVIAMNSLMAHHMKVERRPAGLAPRPRAIRWRTARRSRPRDVPARPRGLR